MQRPADPRRINIVALQRKHEHKGFAGDLAFAAVADHHGATANAAAAPFVLPSARQVSSHAFGSKTDALLHDIRCPFIYVG